MSGKKDHDRLKELGLATGSKTYPTIWIGDVQFAPPGHALFHPRASEEADEALIASIMRGWDPRFPLVLWEETLKGGEKALYVIDGSRRTNAGIKAEEAMKLAGTLKGSDKLMAPFVLFKGEMAAACELRIAADSDPSKKPHNLSVLCATFQTLESFGRTHAQIAEVHGRFNETEIGWVLRFPTLPRATRVEFDSGALPVSALGTFLDEIAPDDHDKSIDAAKAVGGTKKPRKAKKAAKAAAGLKVDKVSKPSTRHWEAFYGMAVAVHPIAGACARAAMGDEDAFEEFPDLAQMFDLSRPKRGPKGKKADSEDKSDSDGEKKGRKKRSKVEAEADSASDTGSKKGRKKRKKAADSDSSADESGTDTSSDADEAA